MSRGPEPDRTQDGRVQWFPADITIEDTTTGERRTYETWEALNEGEFSDFIWVDGNYSCDCNRLLFFEYANGRKRDEIDEPDGCCGSDRFRIVSLVDARTGQTMYEEAELTGPSKT